MTAYTSSQTGNWSSASTWGGSGVPGDGDTASIGAHTVTVDVNTTVGTSPNDTTTKVIDLTSASSVLKVAAGITLTVMGNRGAVNGSTFQQEAGSTVTFDASGSGGSPVYTDINVGFTNYTFNGASGSRAVLQAVAGKTCKFSANWGNVTATFTTFRRCSSAAVVTTSGGTNLSDHLFDTCAKFDYSTGASTGDMIFDRVEFLSGTDASEDFRVNTTSAAASGARRISGCKLDKSLTYVGKTFTVKENYFGGGATCVAGSTVVVWRNNFSRQDGSLNGGNGALFPFSVERNYWVVDSADGNPHFLAPTALLSADNNVSQNVFEGYSTALVDVGDCILPNGTVTSGGTKIVGKNNIVLPLSRPGEAGSSGCMLTMFNLGASDVAEMYRNTANVDTVAAVGKRGMFAVAEASDGAAGQLAQLKSNVGWGSSSGQGYFGERVQGNVKDIITAANAQNNWAYNLSAGDNQRGYEDKLATNTLWTAGDAVAAGVDTAQGTSDPVFYDKNRNIASWAVARGYGSDYAAGLTALRATPSRVADLIQYIFEGFRPSNASMRSAAHDGGCVGAANFYKSRSLSPLMAHRLVDVARFLV